jgi:hypothetical protein
MNDRIRELAEHCDFYVGNEHYKESYEEKQRLWTEKFAELIVNECLGICEELGDKGMDGHYCADKILKHFGVNQ